MLAPAAEPPPAVALAVTVPGTVSRERGAAR
jgi:hypothetical protein